MKIAYLTPYNSDDVTKWSGLGFYIRKCLQRQGMEIVPVNCQVQYDTWTKLKARFIRLFFGKSYQLERSSSYLKSLANKAESELAKIEYDIVFSPGSLPLVYLRVSKPIVFWADATYDCLVNFYNSSDKLFYESEVDGNKADSAAIKKASLIFYASEWGRNSAIDKYTANPNKVKQLSFGANIEHEASINEISQAIEERIKHRHINLLFVGVDWKRKGGAIALRTAENLRSIGYDVSFTIVGCKPPKSVLSKSYVTNYPFISKQTNEGSTLLNQLYRQATFLVLPSLAECFGVVVAEANAHGLIVMSSNVGGLTSAVSNGVNGFCFPLQEYADEASRKMVEVYSNPAEYSELGLRAYMHYKSELSWDILGARAVKEIEKVMPTA